MELYTWHSTLYRRLYCIILYQYTLLVIARTVVVTRAASSGSRSYFLYLYLYDRSSTTFSAWRTFARTINATALLLRQVLEHTTYTINSTLSPVRNRSPLSISSRPFSALIVPALEATLIVQQSRLDPQTEALQSTHYYSRANIPGITQ